MTHITNLHIGLSGQIDRFVSKFAVWCKHRMKENISFTVLSPDASAALPHAAGRAVPFYSDDADTAHSSCIAGLNAVIYFCTALPPKRSAYGSGMDSELFTALQIARSLRSHAQCRLILVMRDFPNDGRTLGSIYAHWRRIEHILRIHCPNISTIRTAPVLDECDAVTLAIAEYALIRHKRIDFSHMSVLAKWLSLSRPAQRQDLFEAIANALTSTSNADFSVFGNTLISYRDWAELFCAEKEQTAHRLLIDRFHGIFNDEMRTRSALLEQTLSFHTVCGSLPNSISPNTAQNLKIPCRDCLDSILEEKCLGASLLNPGSANAKNASPGYTDVCMILRDCRRSAIDIANLFTLWLPRYIGRALQISAVSDSHISYRFAGIAAINLEKSEISPTVSRLVITALIPVFGRQIALHFITAGTEPSSGALFMIADTQNARSILKHPVQKLAADFGSYLRDYGCGC